MARSEYIYLVCWHGLPLAAFTVKHECATFLRNEGGTDGITVFRLKDRVPANRYRYQLRVEDILEETSGRD